MLEKRVSGVEARHWVLFFKTYAEAADPEEITRKLTIELKKVSKTITEEAGVRLGELLREMQELL